MLTVLYQTSPLLSSWNVPSVFWSHHCNVHPNKAEREYNNNYNMYHVYMLTFKNCFRLTKANRAHDVDHFFKHMISKNWVDQNRFFSIILYSATNFIQFHEYFYIFANQRKYFTRFSGFLTSANNFENDFTINCQQSFFYTSCWLTVIIHIIKHKIFERNENPGDFVLFINGVFKCTFCWALVTITRLWHMSHRTFSWPRVELHSFRISSAISLG